uniref:Uncharacterized protein n=1 Tax=Anguilla anguilla TaxID=7936 RepID=A0A0E9U0H1_ANGAN
MKPLAHLRGPSQRFQGKKCCVSMFGFVLKNHAYDFKMSFLHHQLLHHPFISVSLLVFFF